MRLTVLGKSPAWQDAGGACSGYLITEDETTLLLDCGNGVFAKLRDHIPYADVDAIAISHMHADHFFDLISFAHALLLAPSHEVPPERWTGEDRPTRPRLIVPAGGRAVLRQTGTLWDNANLVEFAFPVEEYDATSELEVGPLSLRFTEVPHYVRTHAVEVRSAAGGRITFSADCRPNDALVEFARETDLLLVEATLPRPERTGTRGHLTAREAGDHARRAAARRVVLTHVSDELDEADTLAEGAAGFGAAVELAQPGAVYEIP